MKIGWIGVGRMGHPMVVRLLNAGFAVHVWNRTRVKAVSLRDHGATIAERKDEMRDVDVLFTMLATGRDVIDLCFGADGVIAEGQGALPRILVDCSTIGVDESAVLRARLAERGIEYLAAPVSGNPKCVEGGKLSSVVSGPRAAFDTVKPMLDAFAARGVAYAGDGELARICKIAHNLMVATVIENLTEITLLAHKAGVPRHAFLEFINNSVLGSIFTRYKSPALVNLDWTTTFTPIGLRKDIDLGLATARELGVSMPVTAAVREVFQAHFGAATLQPDAAAYVQRDFAAVLETMALMAGMKLESEKIEVATGLET
jgi:3-hydroxyisobutyrate dehydrogenase